MTKGEKEVEAKIATWVESLSGYFSADVSNRLLTRLLLREIIPFLLSKNLSAGDRLNGTYGASYRVFSALTSVGNLGSPSDFARRLTKYIQ